MSDCNKPFSWKSEKVSHEAELAQSLKISHEPSLPVDVLLMIAIKYALHAHRLCGCSGNLVITVQNTTSLVDLIPYCTS